MTITGPGTVPPSSSTGTLTGLCRALKSFICCSSNLRDNLVINSSEYPERFDILIIDDNQVFRRILKRMLNLYCSDKIKSVTEASCPIVGLHNLASNKFDIIFMDIDMPLLTGIETTQIIRGARDYAIKILPKNKQIPIIAVTTNDSFEDRKRYIEVGMSGFMAKPFTRHQLIDIFSSYSSSASTLCEYPASPDMVLKPQNSCKSTQTANFSIVSFVHSS